MIIVNTYGGHMRFGICTNKKFDFIKGLGFAYAEANLSSIAKMSDEEFEYTCSEAERVGLKCETVNLFCRSALRISCDVDLDAIRAYSEAALARAKRLGCEVVVVGSGGARKIIDGYTRTEAEAGFVRALQTIADVAKSLGMKIAIEPINRYECNFVHTVEDAARICEAVARENVGVTVDFYHVYKNGEDLCDILKYGKHIMHVHIARMNDDRGAPTLEDGEMMKDIVRLLDQIGYDGRISLEATLQPDFDTAVTSYAELLKCLKMI